MFKHGSSALLHLKAVQFAAPTNETAALGSTFEKLGLGHLMSVQKPPTTFMIHECTEGTALANPVGLSPTDPPPLACVWPWTDPNPA